MNLPASFTIILIFDGQVDASMVRAVMGVCLNMGYGP